MRYVNISISIPDGYPKCLDEESSRYGLNRSEFIRILFDAYLTVAAAQVNHRMRETSDFFHDVFPHRREESTAWLHDYLRIVIKIYKERETQKKGTGSIDRDSVYDSETAALFYPKKPNP